MRNIAFLKNKLFPKCSFSEKVDTVQKYLLLKSCSFLDIFILNREKKTVPKSNYDKELLILKKWLLYRISALKKEAILKK